jgi:glycosyltransferase involved in cell wall biosynthesis
MESAEYWQQCESIINDLPPNITVTYRGEIPAENIKARLIKSHLFILPTQGENFGHAIFEAFGAARPVLISDQTPWRTLQEKKAGADIGLQHPEKWIAELEKFIQMEQHEFDRSCVNALKLAIAFIRESDLKNKYLELFS